jgi:hypothetical protein
MFFMKRLLTDHKLVTAFVTIYLIVYTLLHQAGASFRLLAFMFVLSPFLVGWMAYTILRFGKYEGRELQESEEWGYQDRDKNQ